MLVRGRETLAVLFISLILSLPLTMLLLLLVRPSERYWGDIVWSYALLFLMAAGLVVLARRWQVDLRKVLGPTPGWGPFGRATLMAVPLVLLSLGTFYLLYYPMSFAAPAFVEWALEGEPVIVSTELGYPAVANLANFVALVVLVPVVEEMLFRGFLFRRWARKWGTAVGILASSAVFALLHFDVLGAFAFGAFAAVLYARSGKLWLPIALHLGNNLLAWLAEAAFRAFEVDLSVDLSVFRREWWLGAIGLVLGSPWVLRYLRRNWPVEQTIPSVALELRS